MLKQTTELAELQNLSKLICNKCCVQRAHSLRSSQVDKSLSTMSALSKYKSLCIAYNQLYLRMVLKQLQSSHAGPPFNKSGTALHNFHRTGLGSSENFCIYLCQNRRRKFQLSCSDAIKHSSRFKGYHFNVFHS